MMFPCAGWSLDLAVSTSIATKTFTGSYGKKRYGTEGLSMAGPLLLDAPVAMRRTGLIRLLLCKFEIRLLGSLLTKREITTIKEFAGDLGAKKLRLIDALLQGTHLRNPVGQQEAIHFSKAC